MAYKMRDLREVDWGNPHAIIVTDKGGNIKQDMSSYGSFLEKIGYTSAESNNFIQIINYMKNIYG